MALVEKIKSIDPKSVLKMASVERHQLAPRDMQETKKRLSKILMQDLIKEFKIK